jgi:hypothetical protein
MCWTHGCGELDLDDVNSILVTESIEFSKLQVDPDGSLVVRVSLKVRAGEPLGFKSLPCYVS